MNLGKPSQARRAGSRKINALLEKLPTLSESTQLHFLEKAVSNTRPDLRNYILNTTQYEIVKAENKRAELERGLLVELAEQGNISPVVVVRPNQGEGMSKKKRKKKKKTRRKKKLR